MPSITLPTAILAGAGIAGVGSLGSALIGSNAAQSAAQTQAQAAEQGYATELGIYDQTQANLAPYNQVGQSALAQLAKLFGIGSGGPSASTAAAATSALQNYPGYQFGLQQGNLALAQSAAAQGTYLSGAQLQAAQQYGQNYAMQNAWNPYVSTLSSIAGLGESAAATAGQQGVQTGSNLASSLQAAGQASASGTVGSANAITSGLTSATNTAANSGLLYALLSQQNSPAYGGGNAFSGDAYGGSSTSPLAGLTASDYGYGY